MNKLKVPQLRFPGFDGGWETKSVYELASKLNVGFVGTCEPFYTNSSEGILLVRTGNLKGVNIVLDEEKYVSKEFHNKNKKSQIFPGDLLLARHGGNGEICMVPKEFPAANCLNIVILKTNSLLDSVFFQLAYSSYSVQKQISSVTAGSTQGVINTKEIGKLNIIFPSLPEQQKIASFLSAVDEKIQQLSRKKELLEQYKKGVMQQLFSGKLRFKDENRNKYPDWEKKKLGEVITIFNGYAFPSSDSQENGCRWVKIADVGIYEMKEDSLSFLPNEFISRYSKFVLKKGDYVLALTRPILNGKLKIAEIKESFNNSLLNQRVGKLISENHLPFTYYLLQQNHLILKIDSRIAGTDPPNLSPNEIDSIKIKIPINKKEQQKIANYLSSIDAKIENTKSKLEKVQLFKKGLLQQLFV